MYATPAPREGASDEMDILASDSVHGSDPTRVLVVDDDIVIRHLLQILLRRMGYRVVTAADGAEALKLFAAYDFDLVLLDILMPGMDGFDVCTQLRRLSAVPIVILSALNRSDDIVLALELGADTYITKPFNFAEVEARIRALLRLATGSTQREQVQVLERGDVILDSDMREAKVAGNLVKLTRTEFRILHSLMTNIERPLSKDRLLETVWGYEATQINSNLVECAIRRLRIKLEDDPSRPQRLVTVPGVGYRLCPMETNQDSGFQHSIGGGQHRRLATA